ncbi:MAG: dockerin type I repeat-containing protein [Patescibacteria group bacterium]
MRFALALAFVLFLGARGATAEDLTSTNFILRDPVITVEGGQSNSPSFQYISATGQVVSGENASTSFIGRAGFLYFSTGTAAATPPPPPPPSTGGGGGGSPITTGAVFSGRAYPLSRVHVLKDGQLAVTTVAGPDANFEVSYTDLDSGEYTFSVIGEDAQGRRSLAHTFPVRVTAGFVVKISGIFITPTIAVDKTEVRKGDNIAIFGQSVPKGDITIEVNSENQVFARTEADTDGVYLYNLDTSEFEFGNHSARSKAAIAGSITPFGKTAGFRVGTQSLPAEAARTVLKGDLNNDGRVNLVDFSIAAFWYKRVLSASFAAIEKEKLSGDGKVNLVDFSIMAYYWTG